MRTVLPITEELARKYQDRVWDRAHWEPGPLSSDCRIWDGPLSGGYARVEVREGGRRRKVLVHRLMWVATFGPAPVGAVADHRCDTPACIHPGHVNMVTDQENILRGTGLAASQVKRSQCPKGHEYVPDNIVWLPRPNGRPSRRCRECARASARESQARIRARR